jgi:integrase
MQNGYGIFKISQTLGHADVKMTQRYINWQPEDDADMVESLVRKTSEPLKHYKMEKSEQPLLPLVTSRVS